MKKLFHFGIIALMALVATSCSKSSTDTVAKDQATAAKNQSLLREKITFLNTRNHHANAANIWLDASKIYPYINQPFDMKLGNPDAVLTTGQTAVFYIILSEEVANLTTSSATLTASDDATGDVVGTYNLISYRDLGTVDAVVVPAELANVPFMCAIVNLNDQYTNKTISLSSYIQFDIGTTGANLSQAISVIP